MVISVNVRFLGIFQQLSGKKQFQVKLQEPATVRDVVTKLTEVFSNDFKRVLVDSQLDDHRPNALILVEGKEISALQGLETAINDANEVVLVPMIHGG
ncbi:MAG: MoaD/ThiS family protein [Candidatus Bathyarchaeota archaeon]|nr:MoaD/ThiS family protein [Candidatus Bathyarchaeum sp.]